MSQRTLYTQLIPTLFFALTLPALIIGCAEKETVPPQVEIQPEAAQLTGETTETSVTVDGVPGGIETRTLDLRATVEAIDYENRTVTLKDETGLQKTLTIGPEAVNFDQIEKGDQVDIAYVEELVVYLKAIGAPITDGIAAIGARAEEGEKPAGLIAGTVEMTALVTAVNLEQHTATLQFPSGATEVVTVRKDVELHQDQVGREVVFQKTTAIAIAVSKVEP